MVITGTKGVVVGRVVRVRPHPDGDHIWLADLDIGTDGEPQIVWGGEQSEGMLCSLAELGWDPSVTDRVARLNGSAGLRPGDSLDEVGESWPLILRPADEFRAEEILAALESPKAAVSLT